jgi:hypothetical protein
MLQLNDKYYLDSDALNYILKEKKVITDKAKNKENIGNERFDEVGFYGTLESLAHGLIEKEIKSNIEILYNIEQLIQFKKDMQEIIKKIGGRR